MGRTCEFGLLLLRSSSSGAREGSGHGEAAIGRGGAIKFFCFALFLLWTAKEDLNMAHCHNMEVIGILRGSSL